MATKASSTLVLIIEKQYASWGLMLTATTALEVRFCHRLRIASARPLSWARSAHGPGWWGARV